MELFAKIVNGSKPLTIFAKNSISDVRQGYEYASQNANGLQFFCSKPMSGKIKAQNTLCESNRYDFASTVSSERIYFKPWCFPTSPFITCSNACVTDVICRACSLELVQLTLLMLDK